VIFDSDIRKTFLRLLRNCIGPGFCARLPRRKTPGGRGQSPWDVFLFNRLFGPREMFKAIVVADGWRQR